jgi:hypothetical protein
MPTAASFGNPTTENRYCTPRFCTVPTPEVEKFSFPGCLRMASIRSAMVFHGAARGTTQTNGFSSSSEIMVKSFHLYGVFESIAGRIACEAMRAASSV